MAWHVAIKPLDQALLFAAGLATFQRQQPVASNLELATVSCTLEVHKRSLTHNIQRPLRLQVPTALAAVGNCQRQAVCESASCMSILCHTC